MSILHRREITGMVILFVLLIGTGGVLASPRRGSGRFRDKEIRRQTVQRLRQKQLKAKKAEHYSNQ